MRAESRLQVSDYQDCSGIKIRVCGIPQQQLRLGAINIHLHLVRVLLTGDTVRYYVVAQDLATPPNVGANPSAGAGNFTANPPRAGIPPTTPNSYVITASALSGDYTVGLTMFNKLTGNNIYFDKVVTKVKKEVWVENRSIRNN